MRRLTVVSVAYTLAACGPDAVGGAEQVLSAIDAGLVAAGHRSIVVGCRGSCAAGELAEAPVEPGGARIDDATRAAAWAAFRHTLARVMAENRVDLVHMHGFDFHQLLPPPGVPTLVTLHMPPAWYPDRALRPRPGLWFSGVSATQHASCPPGSLPPIPNGVPVARLGATRHARRGFAVTLTRSCPEKAPHLALDAARAAGVPLLIGGAVFPYPAHLEYHAREVEPRLDRARRWLGPVPFARKRRLLSAARCLLAPSLAPETSSLVAMEAAACGAPVIAFPHGALGEIVEHGRTGFLVPDVAAMADAIRHAGEIDPEACRAAARARFDERDMVAATLRRYRDLIG